MLTNISNFDKPLGRKHSEEVNSPNKKTKLEEEDEETEELEDSQELLNTSIKITKTVQQKLEQNAFFAKVHLLSQTDNPTTLSLFNKATEKSPKEKFKTEKKTFFTQDKLEISVGMTEFKGKRLTMQDVAFAQQMTFKVKDENHSFEVFGVCDGHGLKGEVAAAWVKDKIAYYFKEQLEKNVTKDLGDEEIFKAFKKAVICLNSDFNEDLTSGTTLAAVVKIQNKFWNICVGDSEILFLDSLDQVIQGNDVQNVHNKRHLNKALKAGHTFIDGRIDGFINVTRAIGDKCMEKPLSCHPKITCIDFDKQKIKTIVIFSDGVARISGKSIGQFVCSLQSKGIIDPSEISKRIVLGAYLAKSKDNITATVVQLPDEM